MKLLLFVLLNAGCLARSAEIKHAEQDTETLIKIASKWSPERQRTFQQYFNDKTEKLSQEDHIKLYAKIHNKDPEIYKFFQVKFGMHVKNFDDSEEGRDFLKYYYAQIDQMPDDSQESYDKLFSDVQDKWKKLSEETKDALNQSFTGMRAFFDKDD
ncbi:hypothetical protein M3Y97_01137700 [Aphelenchoides bicaudatus]|nr:hypothetical protein M3Y97_01137700 [Aphelenchoides bicaudatus]